MGCSLSVWLFFVSLHVVRFIFAQAIDAPATRRSIIVQVRVWRRFGLHCHWVC